MILKQATERDFDAVMHVIEDGRASLAALGIDQWQGGGPNEAMVHADIAAGCTYMAVADEDDARAATPGASAVSPGDVLGTLAFVEGGEADYDNVTSGAWLTASPNTPQAAAAIGEPVRYATLHRVAVSAAAKRRGVATFLIERSADLARERGLKSLRADTHEGNIPMQRTFEKLGFSRCCDIRLTNPLEPTKKRIGYERVL